ncbi:serine aminopeptidase domain-containing protein [Nitrospira sp. M1]
MRSHIAHTQASSSGYHNIHVSLEGNGASWKGHVDTMTRSSLRMVIEGYPLVVISQSLHLQLQSPWSEISIEGHIERVTPLGHTPEVRWSRVQLDIAYERLDDLKWHRVQRTLRRLSSTGSSVLLRGTLVSSDSNDCLWKMESGQITAGPYATHDVTQERAARIIEQLPQSMQPDSIKTHVSAQVSAPGQKMKQPESQDIHIVSSPLEIPNAHGHLVRAYHDTPKSPLPPGSPVIIISPGYGETKREYITLAYYFASNGFHVIRYDHTNHVGDSDGEHVDTTLSTMHEDLETVLQYAAQTWPQSPRGLVATSLSGRVAIKATAHQANVDVLILITPIIDIQHTLHAVHQEDLVGNYQKGERKGISNILGFNVSVTHWLADAINGNFSDMTSTIQDVAAIRTPVVVVSAECDAWVQHDSLNTVIAGFPQQRPDWYVIPGGLHRILENPRKAKLVYRQMTAHCQATFNVLPTQPQIIEPTRKAIGLQNKREREQKKAERMAEQLSDFWKDYLAHFHHIVNYGDYQQLLSHMVKLMGPLSSGETILDAGCGNGNFAPFFYLHEQLPRHLKQEELPRQFRYVGIDFVPTALQQAQKNLQTVVSRHQSDRVDIESTFSCTDLNQPLPFHNNTFDKIVSNLVLGYLNDPLATLRELFRVLSPNGTLVLSNLKPNSDLSVIYTNSVQETTEAVEVEEARKLLSNSGKIRQAEGDGIFQFHGEEELRYLLQQIDPTVTPEVYSTFANQAYIAVIKKKSLSTSRPAVSKTTFANAA